jgi:hypothetical protein
LGEDKRLPVVLRKNGRGGYSVILFRVSYGLQKVGGCQEFRNVKRGSSGPAAAMTKGLDTNIRYSPFPLTCLRLSFLSFYKLISLSQLSEWIFLHEMDISDTQTLAADTLKKNNLALIGDSIPVDGNCQFAAVAEHTLNGRERKIGPTWGVGRSHLTAISEVLERPICVYSTAHEAPLWIMHSLTSLSGQPVYLLHLAEMHFEAVRKID